MSTPVQTKQPKLWEYLQFIKKACTSSGSVKVLLTFQYRMIRRTVTLLDEVQVPEASEQLQQWIGCDTAINIWNDLADTILQPVELDLTLKCNIY